MLVTAEEKEQVITVVSKYIREAEHIDLRISRDVIRDGKAEAGHRLSPGPWTMILEAFEIKRSGPPPELPHVQIIEKK